MPPGSTIQSARLSLYCSNTNDQAGPRRFTLHRVTRDWGAAGSIGPGGEGPGALAEAGDATWTRTFHDPAANCPGDVCWQVKGGKAPSWRKGYFEALETAEEDEATICATRKDGEPWYVHLSLTDFIRLTRGEVR